MPRGRPGRTGMFAVSTGVPFAEDGAHVEAVQPVSGPSVPEGDGATLEPVAETVQSVQQPVEAAPIDPTIINLKDVLIAIARSELHDYPGPKNNWSPSGFSKCDRAMILEHSGRPKNRTTDESALFFWIGHILHDAVQAALAKRMPGIIWHEVLVKDEQYHVSGKLDSIRLVQMPDGSIEPFLEVYEYKGVRTRAFDFKMPMDAHVLQVAIYLTFRSKCPSIVFDRYNKVLVPHKDGCTICDGNGLLPLPKRARIAYIGKEDGRIETFTVQNTPELRAEVLAKLLSLQQQYDLFINDGTMPDKLAKRQMVVKGEPLVYKRANKNKGIKVGDPRMEDDHRTYNCDYKGQGVCCADKPASDAGRADGKSSTGREVGEPETSS